MLNRRQISRNVAAAVTQVVVTGIVFFVLYRFLLDRLGIDQIGIWSIVLATVSVSRIVDFGLSAGVAKFVAQALANGDQKRAAVVVETVFVALGALIAILLVAGFPAYRTAIEFLLPVMNARSALEILPFALLSLWLTVIAGVLLGGLDGCNRADLRSTLLMVSHLIYLGLTILWVPERGLMGVAHAQVAQSSALLIASWWSLRRQLTVLPLVPVRLRFMMLKEMLGYGVSFQVISVLALLFDPITKGLISKFGGLALLGYYEMASKLILQLRAVIIESNRVVIPVVSRLKEVSSELALRRLCETSLRISVAVSSAAYLIIALCSPMVSLLWIGRVEDAFVVFLTILSVGWFVNTLAGPAYFHRLGTGQLKWNVVGQAVIAVLNLLLGIAAGYLWGAIGVVVAFSVSLAAGSMVIIFAEAFSREIVVAVLKSDDRFLLFRHLLIACAGLLAFPIWTSSWGGAILGSLFLVVLSLLAGVFAWNHWQQNTKRVIGRSS